MRSRGAPMINTEPPWAQPRTSLTPARASRNTSFGHMLDSHGRTLLGGLFRRPHSYRSLWFDLRRPRVRSPHQWPPRSHVPCRQPPEPLLQFAPQCPDDHLAHNVYTQLRRKLEQRRSLLLSLWRQPQAGAPMQAHLDRHLRIDPRLADGPVLNPWLGAHDPVISPVGLRVHPAGSLETQDEWARPHLHRRCSFGSRARCFTVSIGAPATRRPIMGRPAGGTCSGLRRMLR
jgi:hypothetical protein